MRKGLYVRQQTTDKNLSQSCRPADLLPRLLKRETSIWHHRWFSTVVKKHPCSCLENQHWSEMSYKDGLQDVKFCMTIFINDLHVLRKPCGVCDASNAIVVSKDMHKSSKLSCRSTG